MNALNPDKKRNITKSLLLILLVIGLVSSSNARQFRQIIPITTAGQEEASLPSGAISVTEHYTFSRDAIEKILRKIISKWNTPQMAETLSEGFYDKSRLLDAVAGTVPREATLRLQSVQGIQILQQYIVPGQNGNRDKLVSRLSVTARTQLEFTSPSGGYVTRSGTNEFILKIKIDF